MPKANFEKARREYPSVGMNDAQWLAFFDTSEGHHAMGRILGDIFDYVKAEEERAAGIHRMGRRPRRDGSLEEVYQTVFPQPYSMDPFLETMDKLLAGRSQRAFAPKIPMTQSSFSRLLRGQMVPDRTVLEAIARAAKVHPSFFVEWRAIYVADVIAKVCVSRPNLGVRAYREARKSSPE